MVVVVANLEVAIDERGDAVGGPKLIVPAVGGRTLAQQLFEPLQLDRRQRGRAAWMRLGSQALRIHCGQAAQTVKRAATYAEERGNVDLPLSLLEKL